MKNILAFGDSNTWGLIPGSKPYRRYGRNVRWTGILEDSIKDAHVTEEGLCGRTTVFEDNTRVGRKGVEVIPSIFSGNESFDLAIVMLGTNDCKTVYHATPDVIGQGLEACLDEIEKYIPEEKILLVSPIHLGQDVWRPEKDPEFDSESVKVSKGLKSVYSEIAKRRGLNFLAASDYVAPSEIDAEHMDERSHRIFARAVYEKILEMNQAM